MRALLVIFLGCVAGFWALNIGKLDPDNYVKMYISNYVIEVSVLQFLILLLVSVIVLYFIIRVLSLVFRSFSLFTNWRQKKSAQSAQAALGSGYLSLIKGDWVRAEKSLISKSEHSGLAYVNFLAAAQAAQEQGKITARDDYLNAAYKAAPAERFAIGLTKARLHQKAGQLDQALATLQDIKPEGHKNAQYTAMLVQTYEQMNDWQGVEKVLPLARKLKALPVPVLDYMLHNVYAVALSETADKSLAWNRLPKAEKKNPENVALYAAYLLSQDNTSEAEKLIRSTLKSLHSDELVSIYGSIETTSPNKLKRVVDGWLMARPENAQLHLAAGRFALLDNDVEPAITHLQRAIDFGQLSLAYSLLGETYEKTGKSVDALKVYRDGMLAASKADSHKVLDNGQSNALIGDLAN